MPLFNTDDMDTQSGGTFSFSGTRVEKLDGATEYTLVTVAVDCSGSMYPYTADVEACLGAVVEACRKSPRADNLLIRVVTFDDKVAEVHGFKLLQDCSPGQYQGKLGPRGCTALCDASCDGLEALTGYSATLGDADFDANGIMFVLTDGLENASTTTVNTVKDRLRAARVSEELESILTIMIGLAPDKSEEARIEAFSTSAGFDQFVGAGEATQATLAKVASFVSRSISAQSQQLGTGGASQPLTF